LPENYKYCHCAAGMEIAIAPNDTQHGPLGSEGEGLVYCGFCRELYEKIGIEAFRGVVADADVVR
jgi:hypothetical protein